MSTPQDATTTPPPAQVPVLIGLLGVAVYLAMGVVSSVQVLRHQEQDPDLFWLSRFKMFTTLRPQHTALQAAVLREQVWSPVALETVLPNRWQEGPGYDRPAFWRDARRLTALATYTCSETGAEAVRLSVVRWEKTLAAVEQPTRSAEHRDLLEVPCAR